MFKISYLLIVLVFVGCSTTSNFKNNPIDRSGIFSRPLTGKYRISQRFKPKENRKHKGIDLAGRKNSPIFAAASGRIVYVGKKFRGYGLMILIEHSNGFSTLYSHLNKTFVKSGQNVNRGKHLGAMGRTGRATGVHLHFELMKDKTPIDPENFIKF